MSHNFPIPAEASVLLDEGCDHPYALGSNVYTIEDGDEWQQELLEHLGQSDPDVLLETDIFAKAYSLARALPDAPPRIRARFVECFTDNITCVIGSISVATGESTDYRMHLCTVLKAYMFIASMLLHCSLSHMEQDVASTSAAPKRGGGRKGGAGKHMTGPNAAEHARSWLAASERVLCAVEQLANCNLVAMYSPAHVAKDLVNCWSTMAFQAAVHPAVVRNTTTAYSICRILCSCAVPLNHVDSIAALLFDALKSNEHIPPLLTMMAEVEVEAFHSKALTGALLQAICTEDPAVYDTLAGLRGDQAGIRSVAAYTESLADAMPHLVLRYASSLRALLGYKHYPLRSAVVTALGHVLERGFEGQEPADVSSDQAVARLKSKQSMWDELLQRVCDENAYTRARVLQVIAQLAERERIPLGMMTSIVDIAADRMHDKQATVRRAAMTLVGRLLQHNPFCGDLSIAPLQATLATLTAQLEEHAARCGMHTNGEVVGDQGDGGGMRDGNGHDGAEWEVEDLAAMVQGTPVAASPAAAAVIKRERHVEDVPGDVEQQDDRLMSPPGAPPNPPQPTAADERTLQQLRTMVANLTCAVAFAQRVASLLTLLTRLLGSATETDVREAIKLLQLCACFKVERAQGAVRDVLPLVFKSEQGIRKAVLDMAYELYLDPGTGQPGAGDAGAAGRLLTVCEGLTMGQLGALEVVLQQLGEQGEIRQGVVMALVGVLKQHMINGGSNGGSRAEVCRCVALLSMLAPTAPTIIAPALGLITRTAFSTQPPHNYAGPNNNDAGNNSANSSSTHTTAAATAYASTQQHACVCIRHIATAASRGEVDLPEGTRQLAATALLGVLATRPEQQHTTTPLTHATTALSHTGWFAVAKEAMGALYVLLPAPDTAVSVLLDAAYTAVQDAIQKMQHGAGNNEGGRGVYSTALAYFCFLLGEAAMNQLVHIDRVARTAQHRRHAAEQQHTATTTTNNNNSVDLGMGAGAADAALEDARIAAEHSIAKGSGCVARYTPILAALCNSAELVSCGVMVQSAVLLAMTKVMAVDEGFCDAQLQLLCSLMLSRAIPTCIRCNLVIAVGDLAVRWPNLITPWGAFVFAPLRDSDPGVRRTAMMVLTHLVLNDMIKVRGHISAIAVCMEDADEYVAHMAVLFFHELSQRGVKGANPVYNHLPDILSNLCGEPSLSDAAFQRIMQRILSLISREKHMDGMVEKLCLRFQGVMGVEASRGGVTMSGGVMGGAVTTDTAAMVDDAATTANPGATVDHAMVVVKQEENIDQCDVDQRMDDATQPTGDDDDGVATHGHVNGKTQHHHGYDGYDEQYRPQEIQQQHVVLWRRLAFCLTQLSLSDKGLRTLVDMYKYYEEALWDAHVLAFFQDVAHKAYTAAKAKSKKATRATAADDDTTSINTTTTSTAANPVLAELAEQLQVMLQRFTPTNAAAASTLEEQDDTQQGTNAQQDTLIQQQQHTSQASTHKHTEAASAAGASTPPPPQGARRTRRTAATKHIAHDAITDDASSSAVDALGESLAEVQLSASKYPSAHKLQDVDESDEEDDDAQQQGTRRGSTHQARSTHKEDPEEEGLPRSTTQGGRRRKSSLAPLTEEEAPRQKRRLLKKHNPLVPAGPTKRLQDMEDGEERPKQWGTPESGGGTPTESLRRRRSARSRKVAVGDSDSDGENNDANGGGFSVPAVRRSSRHVG